MFIDTNVGFTGLFWKNLHLGLCPKCSGALNEYSGKMRCDCGFKIACGKFKDLVKGHESSAYRKVVKKYKAIKKYHKKEKSSLQMAIDKQNQERESNIRRMAVKLSTSSKSNPIV